MYPTNPQCQKKQLCKLIRDVGDKARCLCTVSRLVMANLLKLKSRCSYNRSGGVGQVVFAFAQLGCLGRRWAPLFNMLGLCLTRPLGFFFESLGPHISQTLPCVIVSDYTSYTESPRARHVGRNLLRTCLLAIASSASSVNESCRG